MLSGSGTLRRAGLASAAPAQEADAMTTPGTRKRDIRKSLKYGMIKDGSTVLEKFYGAKAAGFEGVEIDSPSDLDLDEVKAAMSETSLVVPGVVDSAHWEQCLSDPDLAVQAKGLAALEGALHDAKAVGATTVLLVPGVVNNNVSYGEVWTRSQEEIQKVIPLCKAVDVKIAIENVWNGFLMGPHEAARYIDEINSPYVGFYFDVGNIVRYARPATCIEVLGPRIMKLDVKEYSLKRMREEDVWKGFDVKIGDGNCDWPAVGTALDNIGYSGWASAEVEGGDAARLKDIANRMEQSLQA